MDDKVGQTDWLQLEVTEDENGIFSVTDRLNGGTRIFHSWTAVRLNLERVIRATEEILRQQGKL